MAPAKASSGKVRSRLGPAPVRFELLEGEPEEQRQTQKKRQVGEQWQRSSEREGVHLRDISIGLQPLPTRPRLSPKSFLYQMIATPVDPATPLGHLGNKAFAASAVIPS